MELTCVYTCQTACSLPKHGLLLVLARRRRPPCLRSGSGGLLLLLPRWRRSGVSLLALRWRRPPPCCSCGSGAPASPCSRSRGEGGLLGRARWRRPTPCRSRRGGAPASPAGLGRPRDAEWAERGSVAGVWRLFSPNGRCWSKRSRGMGWRRGSFDAQTTVQIPPMLRVDMMWRCH